MSAALTQANRMLSGELHARAQTMRAACWLARLDLEGAVLRLLSAKGLDVAGSTMRSKLSCLEVKYVGSDPALVADALYAWAALSQAAHHHAFELAPTLAEVSDLLEKVARISVAADQETSGGRQPK